DNSSAKGKPWTFPKNTLEDAIRIPKEIEEKNAGNPMPTPELAIAVGFRLPSDWRFQDLLRSADQFGLGIAHALGKQTILISQTLEDVPFDVAGLRILVWRSRQDLEQGLSQALLRTIAENVPTA